MNWNQTIKGDTLEVLKTLPDNTFDTIITSPPYNKGYWSRNRNINNGFKTKSRRITYGSFDDCMEPQQYIQYHKEVMDELIRVLKDTGSIFYNHTDILREHQTYFPSWVLNYPIKQIIIWNRKNTPKLDKSYFFPTTEWIFWIQKDKEARTYYDRTKGLFKTNVWEIPPDRKNKHPAPFPIELPTNCILTTTPPNGKVLDPFMGSGTTGKAATSLGFDWIGIELNGEK
jgi:modification methylase